MRYDCVIIGGGVVGCCILDRLSKLKIKALLVEREDDVASGASRANSGIVHAGYDCEPDTLKARFNVRGNELMWNLADELDVPHRKCGSLVVSPKEGLNGIQELYNKGVANGVKVKILNRAETLEIEPNVSDDIEWSLWAEDAGIISPYQLTIAAADRAVLNGAEVKTEAEVTGVRRFASSWLVSTTKGNFETAVVINCAGASAAKINDYAGAEHFETEFRRGDYFVLDNTEGSAVSTVIFPLPTEKGKGILVAPTADGNVIYGPTSEATYDGDTATTLKSLDEIRFSVPLTYRCPAFNKCIRVYAGVRTIVGHDFIVKKSDFVDNFIMTVGICSPGLTSAPAIAEYVEDIFRTLVKTELKETTVQLPKKLRLKDLTESELNALVKDNAAWGRMVCRCEKVTEAEIVEAINSPLPALTVDAVKRRTRAGMGRCQGGFCGTRVMELIAREQGVSLNEVRKGMGHSQIALCKVKEVRDED